MVAILESLPPVRDRARAPQQPHNGSLAQLKKLHDEAEETARLANLLGRSLYAGIALPVFGVLTVGLSVDMSPAPQLVWTAFVWAIGFTILMAYRRAMRRPFDRTALKEYARDLSAILLFAGFAWGAGAFLALPVGAAALPTILFASVPAIFIAYLLRNREALFLFLAPVSAMTAAGCVLKSFEGGAWLAATIVLAAGAIAGATMLYGKLTGVESKPAMLFLP